MIFQTQSMSTSGAPISSFISMKSLNDIEKFAKLPEIIKIPSELFHPYRLIILSSLEQAEFVSFQQLKLRTEMTDGNLASHLRALEQAGTISTIQAYAGRHPKRFYELTPEGKIQFQNLKGILKNYINDLEVL